MAEPPAVGPLPLAVAGEAEAEEEDGGGGVDAGAAFLKLGSLGLGLGAEKKEESDLDSLSDALFVETDVDDFGSFLGADLDDDEEEDEGAMACFFAGGADFDASGSDFRFLADYFVYNFGRVFGCLFLFFVAITGEAVHGVTTREPHHPDIPAHQKRSERPQRQHEKGKETFVSDQSIRIRRAKHEQ